MKETVSFQQRSVTIPDKITRIDHFSFRLKISCNSTPKTFVQLCKDVEEKVVAHGKIIL
jgi:hypothetical protein